MEYALFALGVFLLFSVVGVVLYVAWIARYGIEAYSTSGISIRRKIGVGLKPYSKEIACVLSACRGARFMYRCLDSARGILPRTCVVFTENLYANGQKCIGLAQRVQFMGLPGEKMARYLIWLDLASIRSKSLSYDQIEGLIRHEFAHHWIWGETGEPDPHHTNDVWKKIS